MSRAIPLLLAATLVTSGAGAASAETGNSAEVARPAASSTIAGQYLVTLDVGINLQAILDKLGVKSLFTYSEVFNGFAAKMTPLQVGLLRKLPGFKSIEEDAEINALDIRDGSAVSSWGLDRINQRSLPLDSTYTAAHDGSTVTAYILDTGIEHTHPDFGGRATFGFDAMGDGRRGVDCNGHGTHVAGTVGGTKFGVAKRIKLVSVRVLGCDGRGSWSGVVAGFDWIAANARKPAVVNASLGGAPPSTAVDSAANAVADRGVFLAVAGGNDTTDACGYSPARAARPFTIGATTRTDGYATYSNYGQCIQLLAPGTDITSAWLGGTVKTISGTSMATPHVAGAAALYKQTYGDKSQIDVMNGLWGLATPSKIQSVPAGTANYLLYIGGL
ncbi:S8 family serine peptidase [Actinokineospora sp. HUAS TT18]|uniref:S8 family peptidase n=1 Tax=Actinokineospora sp. HUAS TT18 TaxID=3447451 RepID=UPI003F522C6D